MKIYRSIKFGLPLFLAITLLSCQKESDNNGNGNNTNQKPKVGTTWTYRYYTYYQNGGLATSATIRYKAISEETLGGESWLKIIEMGPDTTVYYLKEKTGGLHQYANNTSNLFCKNPASLNETYTTFNAGSAEDFTVQGVNQVLPTDIGDVPSNYYEGRKSGDLIDQVWFNANAWILRHHVFKKLPMGTDFFRFKSLFLQELVY